MSRRLSCVKFLMVLAALLFQVPLAGTPAPEPPAPTPPAPASATAPERIEVEPEPLSPNEALAPGSPRVEVREDPPPAAPPKPAASPRPAVSRSDKPRQTVNARPLSLQSVAARVKLNMRALDGWVPKQGTPAPPAEYPPVTIVAESAADAPRGPVARIVNAEPERRQWESVNDYEGERPSFYGPPPPYYVEVDVRHDDRPRRPHWWGREGRGRGHGHERQVTPPSPRRVEAGVAGRDLRTPPGRTSRPRGR